MPARRRTLFATSPTARPTPCGAGLRLTSTEPLLPVTRKGREWARWHPHSHDPQPRLTSIMFSFALSIARRIAGPTSRPRARPNPAYPSLFPTMQVIAKFTRRPESVIRWTMFTSSTSSSVSGRRTSTISGSRIGKAVLIASARVVISPLRTIRPSFVRGFHSVRSRSGRAARASRRRPPLRFGISGGLQFRLDRLEQLRHFAPDVVPPYTLLRRQYVRAVGHREPCVEEALEGREQTTALGGPLHADVEHGLLQPLCGGTPTREVPGEVRGRQIAGARGPSALLELLRLRRGQHAVPRGIRGYELNNRLVQGLPDDDAGLAASQELRPDPVVGPAFPSTPGRDPEARTLLHFTASLRAPAKRS